MERGKAMLLIMRKTVQWALESLRERTAVD